jgi:hypothetical protein
MFSLIKTEWLKISRYPAFWFLTGLCILSYPGINYISLNIFKKIVKKESAAGQVISMFLGEPFTFPDVWRTTAYFSSWFIFIPAVLVIMLITNEYTYRTSRQNIIDGWSRQQFIIAKMLDVLMVSILVTVLYTQAPSPDMWGKSYQVFLFALQTFSQLSLAFMIGLIVRKSFIALAIFLFYAMVAEPIAVNFLRYDVKNDLGRFFPFEISDRILPPPAFMGMIDEKGYQLALDSVKYHVFYTVLLIIGTWSINYWIYTKRDL